MKLVLVRLLGMTLILSAASASPALAADELGLSLDGVNWSSSISDPLFDPSFRWVPGDSETATFYVRNQGGSAGDLVVDVIGSQAGSLLDSGGLHITATGGEGDWVTVSESGTHRLLTAPEIADGAVAPIDVKVSFDESSPNQTQLLAAEMTFRITLSESVPGGSGTAGGSGTNTDGSGLPGSGAPELRWIAAIGAILFGTGLALVARRRDAGREEAHV